MSNCNVTRLYQHLCTHKYSNMCDDSLTQFKSQD